MNLCMEEVEVKDMECKTEQERRWCVYIHRNKINNKAYIGITSQNIENRWDNGYGYSLKFQPVFYRAISKYGWNNFEHIIWEDGLSEKDANSWEKRLIALFKTNVCRWGEEAMGYNMTDGGNGICGYHHTEEVRKKISEAHKGKRMSEESKQKLRESKKGKRLSEEHRRKIKERMNSEEVKQKLRESHTNPSEEIRKKMRENHADFKGEKHSRARSVIQLDKIAGEFIKKWNCISDVERALGICGKNIVSCCRGRLKSAGGFKWVYEENYKK